MYIDKSVMEEYLSEKFEALRKQKREIEGRFDDVNKIFDFIGSNDIKGIEGIERKIFLPCREEWTDSTRFYGVFKQAEAVCKNDNFPEKKEFVIKFLSMMGGFKFYDFKTIQDLKERNYRFTAVEDYRLLSNNSKDKDYSGGLELGLNAGINSHFTDNTYVMEYVDFVKVAKNTKEEWDKNLYKYISRMALHYPSRGDSNPPTNMGEEYLKKQGDIQQQILPYRFPLKFLWMWAKKDEVIHPLSLRAFRSFLDSEFMSEIFESKKNDLKELLYDKNKEKEFKLGEQTSGYAEKITNAKIEYFPEIWKKVSDKIMEKLQLSKDNIHHLSLLISLLTLGETDMTNIDELLKTHKQVILYGVPGTGKTHSAKELIRKWSKEAFHPTQEESNKEDDLKDWQFGEIAKEKKGGDCIELDYEICEKIAGAPIVWDIMQFHPNTTYQDFIGGIIPKTGEKYKSLTYEVESGKFKKFCEYASANSQTPFVFIIDEINRANLSEVLGELLYALEYRDEGITIPNFKEPFVIPSNVYIIGTMNNVDKSLATFDLALRRRFGFYEVGVDCDVIGEILKSKGIGNLDAYIGRCQDLNALISGEIEEEDKERLKREWVLGLESHCKIGQAYFAKIRDFLGKEEKIIKVPHLEKLWIYHLQPLIEEYIGFSMNSKEVSDKLDYLKIFWIKAI
ncbi:McrB family protein [Helicobacter brantae]|uniref:AAA+ ATPase domain-containing protein n=1 Tax=Helicobacter brantae TaxID=375927 RepID=A0A3D8IYE4_9HELI|nr:AAA family ATPase [Helicobacter brantae]RDU70289.1 hypothetical protein CQA58_06080 [Helicobacter brantae]